MFPDLTQECELRFERLGVVERRRVGRALEEEDAERIVLFERVHLVDRPPHFPRGEVARVDDDPQHARVRLPPRDRQCVGADGDPCIVRCDLDEIVEAVHGRDRGGDRHQRVKLSLEASGVAVAVRRCKEIGEVGFDR